MTTTDEQKGLHSYDPVKPVSVDSAVDLQERAKKAAAYKAVDDNFPPNAKVIGIGSGSTVVYVAERIAQLSYKDQFICIPTGFQSKALILGNGLRLGNIEEYGPGDLDIAFDGADEVDDDLSCIKGGGACLFQEKLVAASAKKFVLVADYRKRAPEGLGTVWIKGIPIEVVPIAYIRVQRELLSKGALFANVRQGMPSKAGPVITDNNNFIIDAFFGKIDDVQKLHDEIKAMLGVVDTGLFPEMASCCYFGESDGEVSVAYNQKLSNSDKPTNGHST